VYWAAQYNSIDVFRYLVEQGADLEAKGDSGVTPLFQSIFAGLLQIFNILLSCGADISVRHTDGDTVLQSILIEDRGPTWMTCLFDTVDIDPRTLLLMKDIDGDTPVDYVLSLASTKFLVEFGFDSSTIVDCNRRGCA